MPIAVDRFMRRQFARDRWKQLCDLHRRDMEVKIIWDYDSPLKFTDEARVLDPAFDDDEN